MTNKRMAFVPALLLVALAAVLICCAWPRDKTSPNGKEPSFTGKPITYFLDELNEADDGISNNERWKRIQEATNALHQMAPLGVAWLASRLENTNAPGRMERIAMALPGNVRSLLRIRSRRPDELLNRKILSAIVNSGDAAIPILTNYLNMGKYDDNVREQIYQSLSWLPLSAHAQPAVPMLLNNARSSNDMDRVLASYAVASLAPEHRNEAIGIMIAVIEDTNSLKRVAAVNLLKNLGKDAAAGVPALEDAWRSANDQLQREARYALQKITGRAYPLDPPLPGK